MKSRPTQILAGIVIFLAFLALILLAFPERNEFQVVFTVVPSGEQQLTAQAMYINGYFISRPLGKYILRGTVSIGDELFEITSYKKASDHSPTRSLYTITASAIDPSATKHLMVSMLLVGSILDDTVSSAIVILTSNTGDDTVFSAVRVP